MPKVCLNNRLPFAYTRVIKNSLTIDSTVYSCIVTLHKRKWQHDEKEDDIPSATVLSQGV